jgi:hypothetical protein
MLSDPLYRIRALFKRKAVEGDLDDELQFHFERFVEKQMKAGLTWEEAMRKARMELGGMEQVKEECRDARGVNFVATAIQDLRYTLRVSGRGEPRRLERSRSGYVELRFVAAGVQF